MAPVERSSAIIFCLPLLFAGACKQRVPEPDGHAAAPTEPAPAPPPSIAIPGAPHAAADGLVWADPPGWTRVPTKSAMRLATYVVPKTPGDPEDGELAVFHFGVNQGGDVESNLTRWEKQFSDQKSAPKRSERTENGLTVHFLEIESGTYGASPMMGKSEGPKSNYGLIASVVETPVGSYFFKLTAPAKTIAASEKQFVALMDGLKLENP